MTAPTILEALALAVDGAGRKWLDAQPIARSFAEVPKVLLASAVLLRLREQAGDPGVVEAMAQELAGHLGAGWSNIPTDWRDLIGWQRRGSADATAITQYDCRTAAKNALTAALSHVLAEGEG